MIGSADPVCRAIGCYHLELLLSVLNNIIFERSAFKKDRLTQKVNFSGFDSLLFYQTGDTAEITIIC